jgi:carbonic anhydrase
MAQSPRPATWPWTPTTLARDVTAGAVVFLVALPLCLGVALASNAPLFAGIIAGVIGGIVVGLISGSQTSVSGPSPGSTAIVAAQIAYLHSFEAFLLATIIAGAMQIALGAARVGFIKAFFPTAVIKGLLSAIGILLVLKQIPHLLGQDSDPEGEMSFIQPDRENTFSALFDTFAHLHVGAAAIGISSIALFLLWERRPMLRRVAIPAPLLVVVFGVAVGQLFDRLGGPWSLGGNHLVQVPVVGDWASLGKLWQTADFSRWADPAIYFAALMVTAVTSLESLLNLEAVDKLDPKRRSSPPNRELMAQGVGNICCGLLGGIPVTSVVIRGTVNINAGAETKAATIVHGLLMLVCGILLPQCLNLIPLASLAAVLLITGARLVSPTLLRQMWNDGRYQFLPFVVTIAAIIFTDLIRGVLIGLAVSISFILASNIRRPLRRYREKHLGGEVLRIELANQVSFLNRHALDQTLNNVPRGAHVLIDAHNTVYIDPDVLAMLHDYSRYTAPARGVQLSLSGFRDKYLLDDQIRYIEYATQELQQRLTPLDVLQILRDGNDRFRSGRRLTRDVNRELKGTAEGQHPLAVVLSCIDSRSPVEMLFDLGLGDVFGIRIAGNILSPKVLGSMEYACAVAGAKLVVVLGHTRCGAVTAAVNFAGSPDTVVRATGCQHLDQIVMDIQDVVDDDVVSRMSGANGEERAALVDEVARRNVRQVVEQITLQSITLNDLLHLEKIAVVGAMYDVASGEVEFLPVEVAGLAPT